MLVSVQQLLVLFWLTEVYSSQQLLLPRWLLLLPLTMLIKSIHVGHRSAFPSPDLCGLCLFSSFSSSSFFFFFLFSPLIFSIEIPSLQMIPSLCQAIIKNQISHSPNCSQIQSHLPTHPSISSLSLCLSLSYLSPIPPPPSPTPSLHPSLSQSLSSVCVCLSNH